MLIERDGKRSPLNIDGREVFFANLEDYVRLLQGHGAKIYLVLGVPVQQAHFNPTKMITRGLTSFRITPDVDKDVPTAELRADYAMIDVKLRGIAERTGATLLDPFPDICGDSGGCSPFFANGEPKYSDGVHLRPSFVRAHVRFIDFLLE